MRVCQRLLPLAPTLVTLAALQGCGGSGGGTVTPTPIAGPTVVATPSASTITTAQSLTVQVAATSQGSTPGTGTVTVSSGNFATAATTLTNGAATLTLPAGVLAPGSDTLTTAFTPTGASAISTTSTVTVTASTAAQPVVTATPVTYPTAGRPFRALPLASGQVLVSVSGNSEGIQLFSPSSTGLVPGCVNSYASSLLSSNAQALSMALSPSGTTVALASADPGLDLFFVPDLTSCNATGMGYVVPQGPLSAGEGTIAAAFSPDGKYAFVANEYGAANGLPSPGNVGIVALTYDSSGRASGSLVGQISTGGNAIPGVSVSPDGTRLYVTSEIVTSSTPANIGGGSNTTLTHGGCTQQAGSSPTSNGSLTVIDAAKAEAGAGQAAILSTVNAGCSPTRIVETADNSTLYVSARGDNAVLVFSTGMLELNPGNALLAAVSTGGTAPVGLQLFHGQKLLAVANSNRFGTGPNANATILNVAVPTAPAVVQTIPTGLFPREWSLAADDSTLFLTNFQSNTLEVVSTSVH